MAPRQSLIKARCTISVSIRYLKKLVTLQGGFKDLIAQDKVYHMVEYYWTDEFFWYIFEYTLLKPRYNHRTVVQGDIILHVGGIQFQNVEAWMFRPEASNDNEKKYLLRHSRFETYNWFSYPEVFVMKPSDVIQPM